MEFAEYDLASFGSLSELGRGGQGVVMSSDQTDLVLKLYHQPEHADFERIRRLIGLRAAVPPSIRRRIDEIAAWPLYVVWSGGREIGFAMAPVPDDYRNAVSPREDGKRSILRELQHLIVEGFLEGKRWYRPTFSERIDILASFASALAVVHGLGLVVGDISMKNLLWRVSPKPSVFLLDADDLAFAGQAANDRSATPDWAAPNHLSQVESDLYKFALVVQRVLEERPRAPLDPARIQVSEDPALEQAIRIGIDGVLRGSLSDAGQWALLLGGEHPGTLTASLVTSWIDQALLLGDWKRAICLGDLFSPNAPRLELAEHHLRAEALAGANESAPALAPAWYRLASASV